jgi:hypothetical protein
MQTRTLRVLTKVTPHISTGLRRYPRA